MERFKMSGIEPEKKKDEEGITRRSFLKKAGVAIGAAVLGKGAYDLIKDSEPIEIDEMHGDKLVEEARERAEKIDMENRSAKAYNEANEYELYADYKSWLDGHQEENEEAKAKAKKYFNEQDNNEIEKK